MGHTACCVGHILREIPNYRWDDPLKKRDTDSSILHKQHPVIDATQNVNGVCVGYKLQYHA